MTTIVKGAKGIGFLVVLNVDLLLFAAAICFALFGAAFFSQTI